VRGYPLEVLSEEEITTDQEKYEGLETKRGQKGGGLQKERKKVPVRKSCFKKETNKKGFQKKGKEE